MELLDPDIVFMSASIQVYVEMLYELMDACFLLKEDLLKTPPFKNHLKNQYICHSMKKANLKIIKFVFGRNTRFAPFGSVIGQTAFIDEVSRILKTDH